MAALAEIGKEQPRPGVVRQLGETLRTFLEECLRGCRYDWRHHEDVLTQSMSAGDAVLVTFRLSAAELYTVPWELVWLKSAECYLGELENCLVQYQWPGAPRAAPPSPVPGRLAFGWSAAGGNVPAAEHLQALRQVSRCDGPEEPDLIPELSLAGLEGALRRAATSGRPITALHLLCHGGPTKGGTWGLLWSTGGIDRRAEVMDGASLRRVLSPYRESLRVVVICACRGSYADPDNALGSVSQVLHRLGIPIVISSRLPLSQEGSVRFARAFYEKPHEGIDSTRRAFLRARAGPGMPQSFDWAALQLYAGNGAI